MIDDEIRSSWNHLRAGLIAGAVAGLLASPLSARAPAAQQSEFEPWAQSARIAGSAVWTGMTAAEMDSVVSSMVAEHVTVIEADSNLSNYLTDVAFDEELALMRSFTASAHAQGLKVGWYYPTLEVLTPNGKNISQTMAKEHPDWVQRGFTGAPNVFYGGVVFWVEKDMESAWMSPSSPGYREYFLNRVKKIAATGVDYLWGDVPLLNDIGTDWADTNPASVAAFTAETGLAAPVAVNWNDPTWRRWVAWREEEITDFLMAVAEAGRSVAPDFKFIVETVTMDYGATKIALEGSDLKDVPGVTQVWELDAISDSDSMRVAKEDDWIRMIAMNKHARAASGEKPAWIFTYGKQQDDAELVMAESIAAGNSPYETMIPQMATSVGPAYRTRMFGWMEANAAVLDATRPAARLAVLYSPESHDYVDKAVGQGLYATTTSSAAEFWSTDPVDSVYQRQYLAEYTGLVKLLVNNHIPFDVVVDPSAQELARYETVLLPDTQAISDGDAALLRSFTTSGGHLVATGGNPTGWDPYGAARAEFALADVLGITRSAALPPARTTAFGAGEARFFSDLLGRKYLTNAADASTAASSMLAAIQATTSSWLTTDADRRVHVELRKSADGLTLMLHHVNFIGVTGTFSVVPTTARTTLRIPDGQQVAAIGVTSPDNPTPARVPLPFTQVGQDVTFSVPVTEYSLVVVSLTQSGPPANRAPVASDDALSTAQDTSVSFTAAQLLQNDIDPDGDPLTLTDVSTTSDKGGTVSGSYMYTPKAGFFGQDSFTYTIKDGRGGTSSAKVMVQVSASPPPSSPPPSSPPPSSPPPSSPPPSSPPTTSDPGYQVAEPAQPPVVQSPASPLPPRVSAQVRAISGRSKLYVNVDPDVGKGYWTFKIQYLRAAGTWAEKRTSYRTRGKDETRILNLPRGTYRVRVKAGHGLSGSTSAPVYLRK